ncbi:hypothetical protein CWB99_23435 [Pseudoalteromonas rubra]|uniref:Uncharacterized protein n=1 Tax=Pseudoalteromonas rubra TaxID=43658 RepID=A0A5S3WER9_9GAMM|nr:hypothetical protein CWB99_23435 [Pseudoalteromonas rubra]TMP27162.1 hypothetical protein CWC00_23565 [Pseudoalteromonas rubra]
MIEVVIHLFEKQKRNGFRKEIRIKKEPKNKNIKRSCNHYLAEYVKGDMYSSTAISVPIILFINNVVGDYRSYRFGFDNLDQSGLELISLIIFSYQLAYLVIYLVKFSFVDCKYRIALLRPFDEASSKGSLFLIDHLNKYGEVITLSDKNIVKERAKRLSFFDLAFKPILFESSDLNWKGHVSYIASSSDHAVFDLSKITPAVEWELNLIISSFPKIKVIVVVFDDNLERRIRRKYSNIS